MLHKPNRFSRIRHGVIFSRHEVIFNKITLYDISLWLKFGDNTFYSSKFMQVYIFLRIWPEKCNISRINVTRQIHENWLHKTILRLSHLFQVSWAFALFYKSIFKTTFSFLFNITFKTYPSSVTLGTLRLDLRIRLRQAIERDLSYCKLKVIFRSKCSFNTLFRFNNSLKKKIRSGITNRYTWSNSKVTYYGKNFRYFYIRATKHMGICNLTEKRLTNVKQFAISDHLVQCNCAINFDVISILATDCNKFKSLLKESLLIKHEKTILSRTMKLFPLKLSWQFYFEYHMFVRFPFNI